MEIICTSFTFPKCLALPGNDGSCNLCEVLEAHENIGRLCSIVHSDLFMSKIYLGLYIYIYFTWVLAPGDRGWHKLLTWCHKVLISSIKIPEECEEAITSYSTARLNISRYQIFWKFSRLAEHWSYLNISWSIF